MSHFATLSIILALFITACAHEPGMPVTRPSLEKLPAVPSEYSLERFQKSPLAKQCKLLKPAKKGKRKVAAEIKDYACAFGDAQVIVGFYKGQLREQNGIFSSHSAGFAAIRDSLKSFKNDYYWIPFQAAEPQPPPCDDQCKRFVYTSEKIVTKAFFKGDDPVAFWQENAAVEDEFFGKIHESYKAAANALAQKKYKDCVNYVEQARRMVTSVDAFDQVGAQCEARLGRARLKVAGHKSIRRTPAQVSDN